MKPYIVIFDIILFSILISSISYDMGYRYGYDDGRQDGILYIQKEAVFEGHGKWYFNGQNTEFRWISPNIENVDTSIMEIA